MRRQLDVRLNAEDRLDLEQVMSNLSAWRARERAKTLLLLSQPLFRWEVAKLHGLNIKNVRVILQWVCEQPLTVAELPQRHIESQGFPVVIRAPRVRSVL